MTVVFISAVARFYNVNLLDTCTILTLDGGFKG